jgi:hypothetical protein
MAALIIILVILFWFLPFAMNNAGFLVEERFDGIKYNGKRTLLAIVPILNIWTLFKYKFYKILFD